MHLQTSLTKRRYLKDKREFKEIWPLISEIISSGGEAPIYPNGQSMLPLIRPGKDMVTIVAPSELKKDDIVLFVRQTGQFVLHRIVCIKKDYCNMIGDNEKAIEFKIPVSNVLAKVKSIQRDGEIVDFDSKEYKKYLKKLHRKINFNRLPTRLSILKRKIFKKKSTSK